MKRAILVPAIILTGVCASATIVRAQTPKTTRGDLPSEVGTETLERLTYSSYRPAGWGLYLYASPESGPRRLTDHPALDYDATFSPDGRWIVFTSERDGNPSLYIPRCSSPCSSATRSCGSG